jgi:hypothetical protein
MKRVIVVVPLVVLLIGCGDDETDGAPWAPDVTAADFVEGVDNPFFPLPVGAKWVYEADTDEGLEVVTVEVLAEARLVMGVAVTVVRDTVTVDDELAEDTWDWFAQDVDGNVWYLGEDTCEYEGVICVDAGGAWEAGVDGALPGIIMLADPQVGDSYYQEYYAGEAEDFGEVIGLNVSVEVPAGSWVGCVRTRDTTALEPDVLEFKTYCAGVGVVLEEEEDTRVELVEYSGLD